MEDDMLFCQKCGTKYVILSDKAEGQKYVSNSVTDEKINKNDDKETVKPLNPDNVIYSNGQEAPIKKRKGVKFAAWVCSIFAAIYLIMSLALDNSMFAATILFEGLSIAFFVISRTKKDNAQTNNFDKAKKLEKILAVFLIILMPYIGIIYVLIKKPFKKDGNIFASIYCATMIICVIFIIVTTNKPSSSANDIILSSSNINIEETQSDKLNNEITLSDIEKWFESQKNSISRDFVTYSNSKTINITKLGRVNISKTEVTKTDLKFEKDLGCYYVVYFNCEVGNYECTGHARGFIKYHEKTVIWWSLEIDNGYNTLFDEINDEYDDYVVEYYDMLASSYN